MFLVVWQDGTDTPCPFVHFAELKVDGQLHDLDPHHFAKAVKCPSHSTTCPSALHGHHIPGHCWRWLRDWDGTA